MTYEQTKSVEFVYPCHDERFSTKLIKIVPLRIG